MRRFLLDADAPGCVAPHMGWSARLARNCISLSPISTDLELAGLFSKIEPAQNLPSLPYSSPCLNPSLTRRREASSKSRLDQTKNHERIPDILKSSRQMRRLLLLTLPTIAPSKATSQMARLRGRSRSCWLPLSCRCCVQVSSEAILELRFDCKD